MSGLEDPTGANATVLSTYQTKITDALHEVLYAFVSQRDWCSV